jgi:hypothetical protein
MTADIEGKGANATRGVGCGKRFSRKKDNPRNLGFGPQIRGPKSVLQQELKTRCAEREKGGSRKHVRALRRKAKVVIAICSSPGGILSA